MKQTRPHVDINLQELDLVLDQARQAPLSEPDYQKIKDTLHTLVELLAPVRNTEKTSAVLPEAAETAEHTANTKTQQPKPGHGRNAAAAFNGARKIAVHTLDSSLAIVVRIVKEAKYICRRNRSRWSALSGSLR